MMWGALRGLGRIAAGGWRASGQGIRDESGAIAVALALALPAVAGLAFLAVDAGRHYNLHTSMQGAVDAFARAGAAELDLRPDSIERAERAIGELLANVPRFAEDVGPLDRNDIDVRYLRALPQRDADPILAAHETADPRQARFMEVRSRPARLGNPTIATLLGIAGPVETTATSVAGFEQGVCQFAPFFICNPYEGTGVSLFEATASRQWRRRLIALRQIGGSSAQHFPGSYGFLSSPAGHGANAVRDMIAIDRPPACFLQSGVELRPGFIATARDAVNVRFDIYDGPMNSRRNQAAYRPARNVRKGYVGNNCNQQQPAQPEDPVRGLPRDDCFADSSCPALSPHTAGRFGDGYWDFDGYWATNFGGAPKPTGPNGEFYSNVDPPSRYEVYRYELSAGLTAVRAGSGPKSEIGAPICYSGPQSALEDPLDRRILNAAILDCLALDAEYGISGSSSPPLPVTAFARLFLTEPAGSDSDQTIWAELVGLIEPGAPDAQNILRDIVQLYR